MRRAVQGVLLAALLVGVNAAVVIRALGPLHKPKAVLETDHRVYIEMSWNAPWRAQADPPFCWRLLAPVLAWRLVEAGVDMNLAWYAMTNVCLLGFLVLLHAYLSRLGFSAGEAALGTCLAGLLPGAVRWYEYQYWMTDPPALLFLAAGFVLVHARRDAALGGLGAVAVTARETYLLLLPFHVLGAWRRDGVAGLWRRGLVAWAPALVTLWLLRHVLLPHPAESPVATLREMVGFRWRHLFDNQLYFATLGSFGVLLPLVALFPGRLWGAMRRRPEAAALVAAAYASLALANNTDRLLVYAAPVLLPPALRVVREAAAGTGWGAAVPAGALAVQALFWATTPFHGTPGLSIYQPTNWLVVAAGAGFWATLRLGLRRAA